MFFINFTARKNQETNGYKKVSTQTLFFYRKFRLRRKNRQMGNNL